MKILVTGGTGFIGSNLVESLTKAGHNVLVPVRKQGNTQWLSSKGIETIYTDLSDTEKLKTLMKGVDIVFHLASIRGSGWSYTDKQIRDTNVNITESLLRASCGEVNPVRNFSGALNPAAEQRGIISNAVKQFIYISSVSVHGHLNGKTANEESPYHPVTRYGKTKYEAEMLVKKYNGTNGLKTTVIRPVITYGPGDAYGMVTKLVNLINAGKYLTVGDGENRVHLIYIDDLIDGLILAMDKPKSFGETFILAGEMPATINKLVELIEGILKRPVPKIHVPLWFAGTAAFLMETFCRLSNSREPVITRDKIDIMTVDRAYDISKAKKALGFSPVVDYEEGLSRTISWLTTFSILQGK